jgi:hypothetical protein
MEDRSFLLTFLLFPKVIYFDFALFSPCFVHLSL